MKIQQLEANLRKHIWARIKRGEWTGLALSRVAGFQQAHLSNFLNARRGLSLASMDRLLEALEIGVLELVEPEEIRKRVNLTADTGIESVPVISLEHASLARFPPEKVLETVRFKKTFLRRLKANLVGDRSDWERFVAIKADAADGLAMTPRIRAGAMLLIDRHHNSTAMQRSSNIFMVGHESTRRVRYATLAGNRLILRPHNRRWPIDLIEIEPGRDHADYIVGRVCHIASEA
jgi:transcriptional regulator with XRE-family HTH domain